MLSGAYVGAAKLGLDLDVAHGVITPVWAPSGIALAALLILGLATGLRSLGAFVANLTSDASPGVAAGIAVGNTLEAVVGAALVRRFGFRPALDRVRVGHRPRPSAARSSAPRSAATNGVTVLTLAGERPGFCTAPPGSSGGSEMPWAILMVAPLLLVLVRLRRHAVADQAPGHRGARPPRRGRRCERDVFLAGAWRYPYLLFPLLLWAALRSSRLGAAAAAFLVGAFGTWGAVDG